MQNIKLFSFEFISNMGIMRPKILCLLGKFKWIYIGLCLLFGFALNYIRIYYFKYFRNIIDQYVENRLIDYKYLLSGLAVLGGGCVLFYVLSLTRQLVVCKEIIRLRSVIFDKIRLMSYDEKENIGSGGVISRLYKDVYLIEQGLTIYFSYFVVVLIFILMNSFVLGGISMVYLILFYIIAIVFGVINRFCYNTINQKNNSINEDMEDVVSEIYYKIKYIYEIKWNIKVSSRVNNKIKNIRIKICNSALYETWVNIGNHVKSWFWLYVVLLVSVILLKKNKVSIGEVLVVLQIFWLLLVSIRLLSNNIIQYNKSSISVQRVKTFIDTKPKIRRYKYADSDYLVLIKNGNYYKGGRIILNCLSFQIKMNEVVGIKGDNGAGKSTLGKVLSGYYSLDKGELYFSKINMKGGYDNVEYIGKDEHLDGDKWIENLCGANKYDPIKVKCIMDMTGLNELIKNDRINNNDNEIARLINVGRALYGNKRVIVFDETLDDLKNYAKVVNGIFKAYRNNKRSIIVITHNMDVYNRCKIKYKIENGKLV